MNWTRIAYNADAGVTMPSFAGLSPWRSPTDEVPAYPRASNDTSGPAPAAPVSRPTASRRAADPGIEALRAELRAMVAEELAQLIKR